MRKLTRIDRSRLGARSAIGLAVILFLAVNSSADALPARRAARPDRGPPVHALRRHARRCWPRSTSRSTLRFYYSEQLDEAVPDFQRLCHARARAARAATPRCPAARCGSSVLDPRRSRTRRTARSPTACRRADRATTASSSISAWPAPTRPTTSRSIRVLPAGQASASSNTT